MTCNACILCSILIECNFKVFNDHGLAFFGGFLFKLTLGWDRVVVLGILCGISLSCDKEGASSIFIKELGRVKCKRLVIYKLVFMLCPTALFHHLWNYSSQWLVICFWLEHPTLTLINTPQNFCFVLLSLSITCFADKGKAAPANSKYISKTAVCPS